MRARGHQTKSLHSYYFILTKKLLSYLRGDLVNEIIRQCSKWSNQQFLCVVRGEQRCQKVRGQSHICSCKYPCQQIVTVLNEIVPEMSGEVQQYTLWPHALVGGSERKEGARLFCMFSQTGLALGFPQISALHSVTLSDALVTGMGFQQGITSCFTSFKTGFHSWLVVFFWV